MTKVKTSELIGISLDYAVATIHPACEGLYYKVVDGVLCGLDPKDDSICLFITERNICFEVKQKYRTGFQHAELFSPSTEWKQGGPIIEREKIAVYFDYADVTTETGRELTVEVGWKAHITPRHYWQTPRGRAVGETPLIAAMRCYVASKLGDEVDVPA